MLFGGIVEVTWRRDMAANDVRDLESYQVHARDLAGEIRTHHFGIEAASRYVITRNPESKAKTV